MFVITDSQNKKLCDVELMLISNIREWKCDVATAQSTACCTTHVNGYHDLSMVVRALGKQITIEMAGNFRSYYIRNVIQRLLILCSVGGVFLPGKNVIRKSRCIIDNK